MFSFLLFFVFFLDLLFYHIVMLPQAEKLLVRQQQDNAHNEKEDRVSDDAHLCYNICRQVMEELIQRSSSTSLPKGLLESVKRGDWKASYDQYLSFLLTHPSLSTIEDLLAGWYTRFVCSSFSSDDVSRNQTVCS